MGEPAPYVSVRYNEDTLEYYADFYSGYNCIGGKHLTGDEADSLASYLPEGDEIIDIPLAEVLEECYFEDDSNFLYWAEKAMKGNN